MSQSGRGIRLPSGKQVRPRVVNPMLKLVEKYDEALKLVGEMEESASRKLKESEPPAPPSEGDQEK
jgi:hypothetical protein